VRTALKDAVSNSISKWGNYHIQAQQDKISEWWVLFTPLRPNKGHRLHQIDRQKLIPSINLFIHILLFPSLNR
jgi:hypothetical protein